MSVVSGRTIFCEGKQTSLDSGLLNRIVEGISGNRFTVVPVGGKFNFSNFVQGYFSRNEEGSSRYIAFRDRDFDARPTPEIQLLQLNNRRPRNFVNLTHRACIENYLLDANLIHEYWHMEYAKKQADPIISRWGHGDSPGISDISLWIENSARNLMNYQSVRWALGELSNNSAARGQLKTTWTGSSGSLPVSLSLESCQVEALGLISQFQQAIESVTEEHFRTSLDFYLQYFNQEDFWDQRQYLIWFHGKDLQKDMQRQQPRYISLSPYFNWAISHLDINSYPDLVELRTRLEAL